MVFAYLALIIIVILGLFVFVMPPITWWFYRKYPAYLDQQYRTFWPRFWASITDGLVLLPLALIAQYYLTLDTSFWDTARWLYVVIFILNYTYPWVYSIYMHGRFGQTVGKMSTCVRVVDVKTEAPITFRHALLRDSVPILILITLLIYESYQLLTGLPISESYFNPDWSALTEREVWTVLIVYVWWFAEFVTMLTNDKRRAVHDFIAGTVVIRTNIEESEED